MAGTDIAYGHGYSARCCSGLQRTRRIAISAMAFPSESHRRNSPSSNTLIRSRRIAVTGCVLAADLQPPECRAGSHPCERQACRCCVGITPSRFRPALHNLPAATHRRLLAQRHPPVRRIESAFNLETSYAYTRSRSPELTFFYWAVYPPLGRRFRIKLPCTPPRVPRTRTISSPFSKSEHPPTGTSAEALLPSRQTLRQSVPPSRTGLNCRRVCHPSTRATRRNGTRIFSSRSSGLFPARPSSCLGGQWIHLKRNGKTTDSFSGELAGDFMFWPTGRHRFGWYLEPAYDCSFVVVISSR